MRQGQNFDRDSISVSGMPWGTPTGDVSLFLYAGCLPLIVALIAI